MSEVEDSRTFSNLSQKVSNILIFVSFSQILDILFKQQNFELKVYNFLSEILNLNV